MTTLDALKRRKSVRQYPQIALNEQEMAQIRAKIDALTPLVDTIKVQFSIVPTSQTNCKFNAEYCLVCHSEVAPLWLENVGYMLQQLDLFFASMDVGCCWYGMGNEPSAVQSNGLTYCIMLCFGKCASNDFRADDSEFVRKHIDEFWNGLRNDKVANLARLAPSACNSQPWRVENDGDQLFVLKYADESLFANKPHLANMVANYFNYIDMGIFLCVLENALAGTGHSFLRQLQTDQSGGMATLNQVAESKGVAHCEPISLLATYTLE